MNESIKSFPGRAVGTRESLHVNAEISSILNDMGCCHLDL